MKHCTCTSSGGSLKWKRSQMGIFHCDNEVQTFWNKLEDCNCLCELEL